MMSHLSKLNTKSIPVFAVGFAGTFSAGLLEVGKFHGLGHNEALLKICMNTSSGLGCLSSPKKYLFVSVAFQPYLAVIYQVYGEPKFEFLTGAERRNKIIILTLPPSCLVKISLLLNSPGFDLIRTSGKEVLESQSFVTLNTKL